MQWEREMGLRDSARAVASRCSADVLSGRYRLDGLLGSGGAADVYRGFDLRLKRSVAIKVFRPDTGFDGGASSHGEGVVLARLHHPGLVTAYDAGQHQDRAFLVMQLIEGTTLKHRIVRGPLSFTEAAVLGADLAHALTHAHEANIVHRDVKPSNILLDANQRPYLTDFGISRLLDTTTRTATGTLIGTAAYLSPEQVLGQPVGRPADVYALGLVLLECLTGRLEYDGLPLEAAIARLHRKPIVPEGLPPQLADVLRAMTALDENERPTAPDCACALAKTIEEARTAASPSLHALSTGLELELSARADESTHRTPLQGKERTPARTTAARATSARRRPMAVGVGITLFAITATTLAISGNSATQRNDPSGAPTTSVPDAAHKREETGAAEKSPVGRNDEGQRSDVAPGRSDHAAPPGPAQASDSETEEVTSARTTPGPTRPPGLAAHDREKAAKPPIPPGQAKKAATTAKGKGGKGRKK
ncbi:serine/threonine-protein kinase [Streptomyces sp. NPDC005548]|uniref:serine/threonine-protein kinase n=1 Tax=Streptomyces sp. NPDC005548 TaxID=3364724 RepID=UPI003696F3C6